ncbi:adenine deaminase [Mariniblastus fucicola]|uniref:Adenine deaminase n=1 Tax=Mariniblastus fucicola TaxID=980251 RepID=A0A5B9PCC6_9BACT|nr:adenine deaminase [Mariniblastus fucicola]QEG20761.1 Adenine deaminase [Mariniblastus fucicola]
MLSLPEYNLVDVLEGEICLARVCVENNAIASIERLGPTDDSRPFLMPGFVDAHIHVESSMLLPGEFARIAVTHGTVATVSDPHEIANVCGIEGVEMMLHNASQTPFKFCFGAPSCVPATRFETAGAELDVAAVTRLLDDPRIGYLSEVMDFPGVLSRAPEVMAKIRAAIERGKPVDGHAPGLRGEEARNYLAAGITTDHECFTIEEAIDKLAYGCKIAIREGSAARNFAALEPLIDSHPDMCMLCSDDKHPDEFLLGHINKLAARAVAAGRDLMNVLQVACVNPVQHYGLDVGLLRVGDPADFIVVKDLKSFDVSEAWLDGEVVARNGKPLFDAPVAEVLNNFVANPVEASQLSARAEGDCIRLIEAIGGQLITGHATVKCTKEQGILVPDPANDVLKIVVVNRYANTQPAVAFVRGFGLKDGALASSVAHDSHNVVAVGANDVDLVNAINAVIAEQGGLSFSNNGDTEVLSLPIAGLMSGDCCDKVAEKYERLDQKVKEVGSTLRAPYMTLSFMALLVIPSLKISDKGLFDVDKFEFASLAAD